MNGFEFEESAIPADMTDGDAIDFLRLTCKAKGLRRAIATRRGYWRGLAAELAQVKTEMRVLARRYI